MSLRKKITFLVAWIRKQRPTGITPDEKSIAWIQTTGLGDAALLFPFVKYLKQEGYSQTVICKPAAIPLWQLVLPPQGIISLPIDGKTKIQSGFQKIIVASISPEAALVSMTVPAFSRWGMIEGKRWHTGSRLAFNAVHQAKPNEHISQRYLALLTLAGLDKPGPNESIKYQCLDSEPDSYILLHPGAKWKPRRWPVANFRELCKKLLAEGFDVRILLHQTETDLIEEFRDNESGKPEITDKLCESIDLIKNCKCFIGNDSGPAHIANLFGKPMIVLWGPGNLERVQPTGNNVNLLYTEIECRPCRQYIHEDKCSRGVNVCLTSISVENVHTQTAKLMNQIIHTNE